MVYLSKLLSDLELHYKNLMQYPEFILFGASKNAKNTIEHLLSIGKKIRYICDNDQLKWGQTLFGIDIVSPSELRSLNEDIPILIASSFYEEIKEQLNNLGFKNVHCIYKLGIDIMKNEDKIEEFMQILSDEKSKETVVSLLRFRCTQDFSVFEELYEKDQYYPQDIIKINKNEIFVDAGAYNGDTAIEYVKRHKDGYKQIYSFEPDKNYFIKMRNRVEEYELENIVIFQKGLSNKSTTIKFSSGLEAGSKIDENGNEFIEILALDDLNLEGDIFIKMDIEGEELQALEGAKNTIISNKPQLAICIYHKPDDLWSIPLYIKSIVPDYKIYIRHHSQTIWETVCYAIK